MEQLALETPGIILDGASFSLIGSRTIYFYDEPIQIVATCSDGIDRVLTLMDDDREMRTKIILASPLVPGEIGNARYTTDQPNIGQVAAERGGIRIKVDYDGKVLDEVALDPMRATTCWHGTDL